nr:uncharacterized protein LOC113700815 [Coffea arabica]
MSKAYDRVKWRFFEEILKRMDFCDMWIKWIMSCISTITYSFNINGELRGYVIPKRGIRQGDPLSPYTFLLCYEGFTNFPKNARKEKRIIGMKICREGPSIAHLFITGDSLVFSKADRTDAAKLIQILRIYEKGSDQVINLKKFSVLFSKNVSQSTHKEICRNFENRQAVS